jgi:hypothetical protein
MEARPVPARGTVLLFGAFFVLSAVVSFDAAGAAPVVVAGSIKCLITPPTMPVLRMPSKVCAIAHLHLVFSQNNSF